MKRLLSMIALVLLVGAGLSILRRIPAFEKGTSPAPESQISSRGPEVGLGDLILSAAPGETAAQRQHMPPGEVQAALKEWAYPGAMDITRALAKAGPGRTHESTFVRFYSAVASPAQVWTYYAGRSPENAALRQSEERLAAGLRVDKPLNGSFDMPEKGVVIGGKTRPTNPYRVSVRIVHQSNSPVTYIAVSIVPS